MSRSARQLSNALNNRLCGILGREGEVVTKWVAVAEVIGPDGRRWLRTFSPEDSVPWDQIGLLTCALQDQASWTAGAERG